MLLAWTKVVGLEIGGGYERYLEGGIHFLVLSDRQAVCLSTTIY